MIDTAQSQAPGTETLLGVKLSRAVLDYIGRNFTVTVTCGGIECRAGDTSKYRRSY